MKDFFIIDRMREGVVTVIFEKTDGTERVMKCTLKEELIPEDKRPKGKREQNTDRVQPVFDVEVGEWRSFRWDSVKKFDFSM